MLNLRVGQLVKVLREDEPGKIMAIDGDAIKVYFKRTYKQLWYSQYDVVLLDFIEGWQDA